MKKIPIRIAPTFFLMAAVIGFLNSMSLYGTIIWVGIIFVSVLVHELGHALTAKMFGQNVHIELVAFGGLTVPEGPKLKTWKEFLVVFMGPFFGFMLFVVASLILLLPIQSMLLRAVLQTFRFVNLFWTAVNLLPIIPLDGGHLVRIILEAFLGARAWRVSLILSLVISSLLGFAFFLIGFFLIGAIFLIFAFQSFETLRRLQNYTEEDQSDQNREKLKEIEYAMESGESQKAKELLQVLIAQTGGGMINLIARQYLAKIAYEEGRTKEVYDTLIKDEKHLSGEGKCLLYMSAYEMQDYELVVRLSGSAFQQLQSAEIAIFAAASHSMLKDAFHAIQWLKTANSFQGINIHEVVKDSAFDAIREEDSFQKFLAKTR